MSNEEQLSEIEVLESIYPNELKIISKDSPVKLEIHFSTKTFKLKLAIEMPKDYPQNEDLIFKVEGVKGFTDEEIFLFNSKLKEKIEEVRGIQAVYTIASSLQELFQEYRDNNPKTPLSPNKDFFQFKEEKPIKEKSKNIVSNSYNFVPIVVDLNNFNYELIKKPNFSLKREDMAICFYDDEIWMYGGYDDENIYSDLLSYHVKERMWYSYTFDGDKIKPPPFNNPFLFEAGGRLCLYGETTELYSLDLKVESKDKCWRNDKIQSFIKLPKLTNNKPQVIVKQNGQVEVVIFGGLNTEEKEEENKVTILSLENIGKNSITTKARNHEIESVKGRFDYASCKIYGNIYYYGGKDSKGQIYDDFFSFNGFAFYSMKSFGMTPPELHSALLFSDINNEYIFLYGGVSENGVEDCLYRYNLSTHIWNLVHVTGDCIPSLPLGQTYEIPRAKSSYVNVYSSIFMIGGYTDHSKLYKEYCDNPSFLHMNLDQSNDEIENFQSKLYNQTLNKENDCDFIIYTNDENQDWKPTYCHKCIITARCEKMKKYTDKDDIYLNNINKQVIDAYIRFLYTGSLVIEGMKNIQKLIEFCYDSTKNYEIISNIVSHRDIHLSFFDFIMEQVKNDYYSMIEKKIFTDLTLEIHHPETNELIEKFHVHKCILFRLKYIKSIMDMGMKETSENVIEFTEISVDSMKIILYFLYKGEIRINAENAIEIYVTSTIMQIDELLRTARKTIIRNIDEENALEIMTFADIYTDQTILKFISYFIINNYEIFEDEFKNFPLFVKEIVSDGLSRKNKTIERRLKRQVTKQFLGKSIQKMNIPLSKLIKLKKLTKVKINTELNLLKKNKD